jgi:hypothetical protein
MSEEIMSATIVSVFILASSILLLFFWLRSATQSILRRPFERRYSEEVAEANQLEYLAIRQALGGNPDTISDHGDVLDALERDYEALSYLLRNAATLHVGRHSPSERLLILDFQLLRLRARIAGTLGVGNWRSVLLQMTTILEYFGNVVGQRLATFPGRVLSQ